MAQAKKGLGKGLGALLVSNDIKNDKTEVKSGVIEIDINKIEPSSNQPRRFFDEDTLNELAESIKSHGIIQPLIVKDNGDYYSIIAGERRWRAARIAKLSKVPVIIKDFNEVETIQVALIENIQREDLNPIEEAECYKRLSDEYFFSQEDIALKVGKSRSVISQYISLLDLDDRVKNFIIEGKLSVGHGKVLLSVENKNEQFNYSEHVMEDNLNIKSLEEFIKMNELVGKIQNNINAEKEAEDIENKSILKSNNINYLEYKTLENDLKDIFGTKVSIKSGKKKGKIEIEYYSTDELDRLVGLIKRNI